MPESEATSLWARAARGAALLAAVLAAPAGFAQEWEFSPGIFVGVTWTDNSRLTTDAQDPQSETSYEISPRFTLNRLGERWTLSSTYSVRSRFYSENSDQDEAFHDLSLNSLLWLAGNDLGVNFTADISQQVIDPTQAVSLTTVTRTANRTESQTYGVEPFYNFALGSNTNGRLSYRYGLVEYDAPTLNDNKQGRALAQIASNPGGSKWTLGAYASRAVIDYDTGLEVVLTRVSGDVGYRITPRSEFVLTVGEDDQDFGDIPFVRDAGGTFWLAGFRGSLSDTTTYEVRAGERFFGDSYLLRFDRTEGKLTVSVSYEEETATRGSSQFDYEDALSFLSNITGLTQPALTPDVYINKRFAVNGTYALPKSSLRLTLFDNDRDYLTAIAVPTGANSSTGIGLQWTWSASTRSRLSLSANWQQFDPRGGTAGDAEPRDLRIGATWRRTIFERSYVSLRLSHNQRENATVNGDYDENIVSLGIGYDL